MNVIFEKISSETTGGYPVGRREGRLSERLPAAPVGLAEAGLFITSKATNSRTNSAFPPKAGRGGSAVAVKVGSHAAAVDRSARSPFKLGKLAQAAFNVFAVGFLAAFSSLLGLAIVCAPFAWLIFFF